MESMSKIVSKTDVPNSPSSVKESVADSSSKEKKILPGRRQQRHSTEIGSEYHRWWVVRNALGFETNEHIAGLLLDGFHGLLQQLVHMCGGEDYQPYLPSQSKSQNEASDGFDDLVPSLSPTSSSTSAFSSSPPGVIEDIEEFTEYKNAITHYCDSLWRLCGLQDNGLQEVEKASHPIQEFLVKLMGYLRAAKGKSYNLSHKKKRFKNTAQTQPKKGGGENDTSEMGTNVCPPTGATVDDMFLCPISTSSLTLVPTSNNSVQRETSNQDQEWIHGQLAPSPKSGKYSFIPITRADKQTSSSGGEQVPENSFVSEYCSPYSQRDHICNTETTHGSLNQMIKKKSGQLNVPEGKIGFQQLRQKPSATNDNFTTTTCNSSPSQRQYENQKDGNPKTSSQLQMLQDECTNSLTDVLKNGQAPNHNGPPQQQFSKQSDSQTETCFQDIQCDVMKAELKQAPCKSHKRNASPDSSWNTADEQQSFADEKLSFADQTAEELDESLNAENCVSNADVEASYEEEYLRLLLNQPSIISQPLVSDDQAMPQFDESQSSQQMTYNKSLGMEKTLHNLSVETRAESVDKPKSVVTERYSGVIKPNIDIKRKELKENEREDPNLANGPLVNLFNAQSDNPSLPQKKKMANIKKNKSKSLLQTTSSSKCLVSEACVVSTSEVNESRNSSQNRVHPRQKIALMVNDSKHQSGANSVPKEQPLAIQPALCPNLDKPHGISAPFGTPVIFYPANSFSSTDNSLASLSSLVQNIVYNSHGTILKPLTPMTSLASNATYNSQGISNTPASSDVGNLRRSVAAALPVLSSHLNAGKTTLVPFYISHMNTLSNLSKSANLPTATGLTHVKVAPQNKVLGSSSTRLYQDWSCANSRLTLSSDTSDWRTQLKITDVRSCSDTDFTNVSTGKHDITLLNGNDQAQLFMKQYECTPVSSCLSSIPSPGFEFVNSWMHSSRHRESNSHLTMSNSETSCHPSPSTYINSTYTAPPSNPLTYPNTSTQQPGIPGNIKSHFKVTTKPQKKILTSLLANKASDYSSSRENIYSNNRSVDQNMTETSLQSLATSTLPTSTSTAPNKILSAHTRTSSESLNVKKKRSRRLLCSVCDLLFYSGTDLLVHRYEQHSHVCGECDGRFLSASRLKQHKESDHPSMMLCSHCRFHTFSKQGLAEHEWSKHGWKIDSKVEKSSELSKSSEANSSIIEKELNIKTNECIELSINSTMHSICQQSSPEESNKHKNNMEQMIFSQANNKQQSKFIQSNSNVSNTALVVQTPAINDNLEKNSSHALRGTLGHDSLTALPHCSSESASSSFIPSAVCDTGPPVFPSFNREVIVKAGKDLASISAMYTQVSEHCRLDSTEISHASDHHFSETDEPRLVIDTEFCGSGKEDGTEGEIGKTDRGQSELNPHSDQPLCLVTHNRKVCRQPKKRSQTKRDVMKRKVLLSNSSHLKVSHILDLSRSEQNERELRNSRKCNIENLNNGTPQNGKTIAMSEESSFLFTTGEIVNLPVIEDQKDKLVMKISLKEPERLAVDCKSLRKKRKKRKKETSKIDKVIYAESLESVAQQEEILKLSGSEKDNLNPFSSNATVSNINNARFDVNTETENTIGEMHKTQQNVEQDVHKLEIVNNPLNSIANIVENSLPKVLEVVKPELLATNFPAKQEKLLSLRDRHIMSSLPPKKRRLRRSSRCSKDETDKLTETVNQNLIENETREDSISQSLSKNVIKVSLTDTRNSERRFKNVIKLTRFSGRCTRLSQFDKISPTIDKSNFVCGNLISGRSRRNLVSTQLQGGSTSVSLISHRYACPIDHCEATFSRKWNLDGHIGKVHSKLSNVSCSVPGCMQKFGSRKDQRQHITMDHKGKTRKYKCSWPDCNKGFFARTHLRIHNLTHTGEKPVACDICDYRCRQRTALIWHMRKHGIFQNDIKVSNTNSGNQMA